MSSFAVRAVAVLAGALLLGLALHHGLALANPDSLWNIVHDRCIPAQVSRQNPGECRSVDLHQGVAVLKDMRGATHYLLLPTERLSGIESPQLLQAGSPNYWAAAWDARRFVQESLGREIPRENLGLSINSEHKRSQNLLHIHVDCVQRELRDGLTHAESKIAAAWSSQALSLAGHLYYVRKLSGADLGTTEPFKLVAARLGPADNMGQQSVSVIGARFADGTEGYYLLDSPAGESGATSDDVLDRGCAVMQEPN